LGRSFIVVRAREVFLSFTGAENLLKMTKHAKLITKQQKGREKEIEKFSEFHLETSMFVSPSKVRGDQTIATRPTDLFLVD
jgi:hypothetical protein